MREVDFAHGPELVGVAFEGGTVGEGGGREEVEVGEEEEVAWGGVDG